MFEATRFLRWGLLVTLLAMAGCAAPPKHYDYTAFKQSKPASLLVLPPLNETPDVNATSGVLSQMSYPLAEAGYYVLPVSLVTETLRQNGMTDPHDAQAIAPAKLRDIFGADAGVYIEVKKYGASYQVVASNLTVEVAAKVVDLRTGALLWEGRAVASSAEQGNSQGGLIGLLVKAVVEQIANNLSDTRNLQFANLAAQRLFLPHGVNGMLYGPRSPNYGKD
jgi:hypothetical protein